MTDLVHRLRTAADALSPPAPEPPHPLYGLMHEAAYRIERQKIALHHAETILMMIEPRNHRAEYLDTLDRVRSALNPK